MKISQQYAKMLPTFARLEIVLDKSSLELLYVRIHKLYEDKKWYNNAKGWESLTLGLAGGAVGIVGVGLSPEAQKITEAVSRVMPHVKEVAVTFTDSKVIVIEMKIKEEQDFLLQQGVSGERELLEAGKRFAQAASTESELRSSIIQATNV
jgi:hypothetical protein